MIKAIFLDFDGTLFSHVTDKIPDSAYEAILKVQEKGIKVFICTGRSKSELTWFDLRGINFDGYVLNNGQVCFGDGFNKLVYSNPLKGAVKQKILEIFNKKKTPIILCDNDEVYLNITNKHVEEVHDKVGSKAPAIKDYNGKDINMAAAYLTTKQDYDDIMTLKDECEITYWQKGAVDIVPKGANKSTGIKQIIDYYNIKESEVMGVGDGENDMAMIKNAAIGIAMGNSEEQVKAIADYVTSDIDDDGLARAFKKYELI